MSQSILFSLLIFSSFLSLTYSKELCHPQDKKVLFQIKKAFGNPYHLASWTPDSDCCTSWYCVECDPTTNRIIELSIFSGQISGVIPPEVGDLPFLQHLTLRKLSDLHGTIPSAIAKLKHLNFLRLSWTNLSGPVPSFLSELKNLTFLDLAFNNLTGSIPASLSTLPNVGAIHLDRNKLTGSIPESFGSFPGNTPPDLYLSHNQLTGEIPTSLGKMNFDTIDLSRNKLEGDASLLFGEQKTPYHIDISRNMFKFNLSLVKFPRSLVWLDLNHNKIYGTIPEGITALDGFQSFNVSYNNLCGKIPVGGEMHKFDNSTYMHNRCLCGEPLLSCK